MADDEVVYVFQASGDACDICSGMDGQEADDLPHEGCACQIVPTNRRKLPDGSTYQFGDIQTIRTGDGDKDYRFGTEVGVECCDGELIGESIEIDGHNLPDPTEDGFEDAVLQALDQAASDLADECEDCDDFPDV